MLPQVIRTPTQETHAKWVATCNKKQVQLALTKSLVELVVTDRAMVQFLILLQVEQETGSGIDIEQGTVAS